MTQAPELDPIMEASAVVRDLQAQARTSGRSDLAQRLDDELSRRGRRGVSVLVVGGREAGKTSLVEALVGIDRLLPTSDTGSIPLPVVVRHGPTRTAILHTSAGEATPLEVDRLLGLASEFRTGLRASALEVVVDDPLTARGLLLVDSPALDDPTRPADAVIATIALADAIVYVTSADAPLRADAVEFLSRAAARVEAFVLVLTKTDLHHGWREVERADRELLATHIPSYGRATIAAVSAHLRLQAIAIADDDLELAAELVSESHVGELATLLAEGIAARVHIVRLGNLARVIEGVIDELELPHRAIAAVDGSDLEQQAFEAEQARLQAYSRAATAGLGRLGDAIEIARIELTADLAAAVAQLSRRFEADIAAADRQRLAVLPDELREELVKLAGDMTDRLEIRLVAAADSVAQALETELHISVEAIPAPSVADVDRPRSDSGLYGLFRTNYYPFLMGNGIVGTMGAMLAAVTGVTASAVAAPIAIAAVAAGTVTMVVGRRAATSLEARTRARDAIRAALADARTELQAWLQRRLLESRRAVEADLREQLDTRTRELRGSVERRQQLLNADRATRDRARADAARQLEELAAARRRLRAAQERWLNAS